MTCLPFRDVAKIEPGDSNLYLLMGKILLSTGDLDKGLQFVNKCVSLDDENRACVSLRKYIKNLRSKIDDAKTKLLRPSIKALEELLDLLGSTEKEPFADPRFPDMLDLVPKGHSPRVVHKVLQDQGIGQGQGCVLPDLAGSMEQKSTRSFPRIRDLLVRI